jgi:hypothetical protein
VIACDFEFINSPNQILFKNEASIAPAATAARYPSADGATHSDQWVWVKPSARLVELQKNRERNRKKEKRKS